MLAWPGSPLSGPVWREASIHGRGASSRHTATETAVRKKFVAKGIPEVVCVSQSSMASRLFGSDATKEAQTTKEIATLRAEVAAAK